MKIKIHFISLLSLILLLGLFFTKTALADTVTLTGHIQDSSGTSIGGATVTVNDPNNDNTTTDPSTGNYSISVPTGTYNVQVTPPSGSNYSSAIAYSQNISANTTLNFILTPSGTVTLSGHIYDAQNNPLPNQGITLLNSSGDTVASANTDSSGAYSLSTSHGTYTLFINNNNTPNYSTYSVPDDLEVRVNNYSLTKDIMANITYPLNKVSVITQDSSGNLISGVTLNSNDGGGSNVNIGGGITTASFSTGYQNSGPTTDSSGNATMWLTSASYIFTANPPAGSNFATTTTSNTHITSSTPETIIMKQPVTLSGFIYDAQNNPLPNQGVTLLNSSGNTVASSNTDSTGAYSLSAAPGTYTLFIKNNNTPNYSTYSVSDDLQVRVNNYSLTQNTTANITYPLHKISIHVQDSAGKSISGATLNSNDGGGSNVNIGGGITTASLSTGYQNSGPTTDSSGNATLWLTTASYIFTATPPTGSNYNAATSANTPINSDTSKTIILTQPVTLSGHIYDAQHNPLPNQGISVLNSSGSVIASANTNSSGAYSLTATSGTYTIFINNNNTPNYSTYSVSDHLQVRLDNYSLNQDTTADITYPLKKINVHVQDPSGNAVSGITLNTNDGGNSNTSIGSGITAAAFTTGYPNSGPITDSSGNATLWLTTASYIFTANPPAGSIYSPFTLSNITVTSDSVQNELVALQYNHPTPVTTATLSPTPFSDGTYADPTTVTLSASAASGFSVASTHYTIDGGSQQTYTAPFTVTGSGIHTITYWSVDNSGVPETANTKTFIITESYSLTGTVYNDANQNGVQGIGENGYAGATVSLNTGQTATTDSNGNYTFANLESGTYTEDVTVPDGYAATTSNPVSVSLAANTTENFGIAQQQATPIVAINAGGDIQGNYAADTDYSGGTTYSSTDSVDTSAVANPAPEAVYKTVRYGNTFGYTIPNLTANGTYTVRLHFNELYWNAAGQRVFNVAINGSQVLSNFDIYQTAGGKNKAIVEQFPATADSNGNITVSFSTVTDNAMVNGIEIYSGTLASPTPTPTPTPVSSLAISAGGQGSGSYVADTDYTGGTTYNTSATIDTSGVTTPAPQAVYQNVRYGNSFSYTIPTYSPNTNYSVRLDFAEPYWNAAGQRLFNVSINGTQVLNNFDVYQAAGGQNKAVSETFTTTSDSNGLIKIDFTTVTDNAMVSGIQISQQ